MSKVQKPRRTLEQTSRVSIPPVSAVDLADLRNLVESVTDLPGSARVIVADPFKAPAEGPTSYQFRGITIVDKAVETVDE